VRADFRAPDGRVIEVLGFWNQDYTRALVSKNEQLTPVGSPHFTVRFTPDQPGEWFWWWVIRRNGQVQPYTVDALRVEPAAGHGFLRRSAHDARYLALDDGAPYFAVGENTAW
jgi:FtsP/CotA-like multicopper oxidase with cupredoxin domain